jgi:hypothetical protein
MSVAAEYRTAEGARAAPGLVTLAAALATQRILRHSEWTTLSARYPWIFVIFARGADSRIAVAISDVGTRFPAMKAPVQRRLRWGRSPLFPQAACAVLQLHAAQ